MSEGENKETFRKLLASSGKILDNFIMPEIISTAPSISVAERHVLDLGWSNHTASKVKAAYRLKNRFPKMWDQIKETEFDLINDLFCNTLGIYLTPQKIQIEWRDGIDVDGEKRNINHWPILLRHLRLVRAGSSSYARIPDHNKSSYETKIVSPGLTFFSKLVFANERLSEFNLTGNDQGIPTLWKIFEITDNSPRKQKDIIKGRIRMDLTDRSSFKKLGELIFKRVIPLDTDPHKRWVDLATFSIRFIIHECKESTYLLGKLDSDGPQIVVKRKNKSAEEWEENWDVFMPQDQLSVLENLLKLRLYLSGTYLNLNLVLHESFFNKENSVLDLIKSAFQC